MTNEKKNANLGAGLKIEEKLLKIEFCFQKGDNAMRKISLPVAFVCILALSLAAYAAKGPCAHQGVTHTTNVTPNYNANGVLVSVTEIVTVTDKGSACLGVNENDCTQTVDDNTAYSSTTTTIIVPNPDGTNTTTELPIHYDYGLKVC